MPHCQASVRSSRGTQGLPPDSVTFGRTRIWEALKREAHISPSAGEMGFVEGPGALGHRAWSGPAAGRLAVAGVQVLTHTPRVASGLQLWSVVGPADGLLPRRCHRPVLEKSVGRLPGLPGGHTPAGGAGRASVLGTARGCSPGAGSGVGPGGVGPVGLESRHFIQNVSSSPQF